MKPVKLLLVLLLLVMTNAHADEGGARIWTDAESGKTITAKLVSKSKDGKKARVVIHETGKSHWLPITRLIWSDQEYIANWRPFPLGFDHLKCTFTGNKDSRKTVKVEVRTHNTTGRLVFMRWPGDRFPVMLTLKKYESKTISVSAGVNYEAVLYDEDDNELDRESALNKTGT